jgi:hypothetical protein
MSAYQHFAFSRKGIRKRKDIHLAFFEALEELLQELNIDILPQM